MQVTKFLTLGVAMVALALVVGACGSSSGDSTRKATQSTTQEAAQKSQEGKPTLDEKAHAYAVRISGGKYEYGGLSAAAFSGCLEALKEEHIGIAGRTYKDEFPEPQLQAVYEKALQDCAK